MKFSENRPVAWSVLIISVLVSIVVFGGVGLRQEADAVKSAFYDGSGDAYFSLNGYINRRAEVAGKLAALGLANLGEGDSDAVELKNAVATVRTADEPNAKLAADQAVASAADMLYARLAASDGVSNEDKTDARLLYADLTDAAGKMRGDEYFRRAEEFNRILKGFPASLLRGLFGVERLEVMG